MKSKSYFTKMGTQSERKELFQGLAVNKPVFSVFDKDFERSLFDFQSVDGQRVIARYKEGAAPLPGKVIVNFTLRQHQYFIKLEVFQIPPIEKNLYQFDFSTEIYKLQRRAHFRVKVPPSRNLKVEVLEANGNPVRQVFRVFDISAGGASMLIPPNKVLPVKPQEYFSGNLKIGVAQHIEINGRVTYQREARHQEEGVRIAGFKFESASNRDEQLFLALVMDIYRSQRGED